MPRGDDSSSSGSSEDNGDSETSAHARGAASSSSSSGRSHRRTSRSRGTAIEQQFPRFRPGRDTSKWLERWGVAVRSVRLNHPERWRDQQQGLYETLVAQLRSHSRQLHDALSTAKAAALRETHKQHFRLLNGITPATPYTGCEVPEQQHPSLVETLAKYVAEQFPSSRVGAVSRLRSLRQRGSESLARYAERFQLAYNEASSSTKCPPDAADILIQGLRTREDKRDLLGYLEQRGMDVKHLKVADVCEAVRSREAAYKEVGVRSRSPSPTRREGRHRRSHKWLHASRSRSREAQDKHRRSRSRHGNRGEDWQPRALAAVVGEAAAEGVRQAFERLPLPYSYGVAEPAQHGGQPLYLPPSLQPFPYAALAMQQSGQYGGQPFPGQPPAPAYVPQPPAASQPPLPPVYAPPPAPPALPQQQVPIRQAPPQQQAWGQQDGHPTVLRQGGFPAAGQPPPQYGQQHPQDALEKPHHEQRHVQLGLALREVKEPQSLACSATPASSVPSRSEGPPNWLPLLDSALPGSGASSASAAAWAAQPAPGAAPGAAAAAKAAASPPGPGRAAAAHATTEIPSTSAEPPPIASPTAAAASAAAVEAAAGSSLTLAAASPQPAAVGGPATPPDGFMPMPGFLVAPKGVGDYATDLLQAAWPGGDTAVLTAARQPMPAGFQQGNAAPLPSAQPRPRVQLASSGPGAAAPMPPAAPPAVPPGLPAVTAASPSGRTVIELTGVAEEDMPRLRQGLARAYGAVTGDVPEPQRGSAVPSSLATSAAIAPRQLLPPIYTQHPIRDQAMRDRHRRDYQTHTPAHLAYAGDGDPMRSVSVLLQDGTLQVVPLTLLDSAANAGMVTRAQAERCGVRITPCDGSVASVGGNGSMLGHAWLTAVFAAGAPHELRLQLRVCVMETALCEGLFDLLLGRPHLHAAGVELLSFPTAMALYFPELLLTDGPCPDQLLTGVLPLVEAPTARAAAVAKLQQELVEPSGPHVQPTAWAGTAAQCFATKVADAVTSAAAAADGAQLGAAGQMDVDEEEELLDYDGDDYGDEAEAEQSGTPTAAAAPAAGAALQDSPASPEAAERGPPEAPPPAPRRAGARQSSREQSPSRAAPPAGAAARQHLQQTSVARSGPQTQARAAPQRPIGVLDRPASQRPRDQLSSHMAARLSTPNRPSSGRPADTAAQAAIARAAQVVAAGAGARAAAAAPAGGGPAHAIRQPLLASPRPEPFERRFEPMRRHTPPGRYQQPVRDSHHARRPQPGSRVLAYPPLELGDLGSFDTPGFPSPYPPPPRRAWELELHPSLERHPPQHEHYQPPPPYHARYGPPPPPWGGPPRELDGMRKRPLDYGREWEPDGRVEPPAQFTLSRRRGPSPRRQQQSSRKVLSYAHEAPTGEVSTDELLDEVRPLGVPMLLQPTDGLPLNVWISPSTLAMATQRYKGPYGSACFRPKDVAFDTGCAVPVVLSADWFEALADGFDTLFASQRGGSVTYGHDGRQVQAAYTLQLVVHLKFTQHEEEESMDSSHPFTAVPVIRGLPVQCVIGSPLLNHRKMAIKYDHNVRSQISHTVLNVQPMHGQRGARAVDVPLQHLYVQPFVMIMSSAAAQEQRDADGEVADHVLPYSEPPSSQQRSIVRGTVSRIFAQASRAAVAQPPVHHQPGLQQQPAEPERPLPRADRR